KKLDDLGFFLKNTKSSQKAEEEYEQELEILQQLLEKYPDDEDFQSYIGIACYNLGYIHAEKLNFKKAKLKYNEAFDVQEQLVKKFPEDSNIKTDFIKTVIGSIQSYLDDAENENESLEKYPLLQETIKLCDKSKKYFVGSGFDHERKLLMKAKLSSFTQFSLLKIGIQKDPEKIAKNYDEAMLQIKKIEDNETDTEIKELASSVYKYLEGRQLINDAIQSKPPKFDLIKEAVRIFEEIKDKIEGAELCHYIYSGLLKINCLFDENVVYEDNGDKKGKVKEIIDELPECINPSIRNTLENLCSIFETDPVKNNRDLLRELDRSILSINYPAPRGLFGYVYERLSEYLDEPFSPHLSYGEWTLKIRFDDTKKINGLVTIKSEDQTLKMTLVNQKEIQIHYQPKKKEEIITFLTNDGKKVLRKIEYFELLPETKKEVYILQMDCSDNIFFERPYLKVALVQLKYEIIKTENIIKLKTDERYHEKIKKILETLKSHSVNIIIFPEFSIPFEYLHEIRKFVDDTAITVIAGTHYITENHLNDHLNEYSNLFDHEFEPKDIRKNICPIIIPSKKILHTEKLLPAKEERDFFNEVGMNYGESSFIFRLKENITFGILICYECLNPKLKDRFISECDLIFIPQTNPKPEIFYKDLVPDIEALPHSKNKVYVVVNGIFIHNDDNIEGGCSGIIPTLDKYLYKQQPRLVIKPDEGIIEQCILVASINMEFNAARDTRQAPYPIKTSYIHIFEEEEINNYTKIKVDKLYNKYHEILKKNPDEFANLIKEQREIEINKDKFIELITKIEQSKDSDKIKKLLEGNKLLIKEYSPLMNKEISKLINPRPEEIMERIHPILLLNS
ncbi:MAG TPA: hypothetical protein VIK14_01525, partial [Ignavibacteria bacterium]